MEQAGSLFQVLRHTLFLPDPTFQSYHYPVGIIQHFWSLFRFEALLLYQKIEEKISWPRCPPASHINLFIGEIIINFLTCF